MSDVRKKANPYLVRNFQNLVEEYQQYKQGCIDRHEEPESWKEWLAQHYVYNPPKRSGNSEQQEEPEERGGSQTDHEQRAEQRRRQDARDLKYKNRF